MLGPHGVPISCNCAIGALCFLIMFFMSGYVEFGLCPIQFGLDSTLKRYDFKREFC